MDNQLENIGKKANEMKIQEKWNENRRKIEGNICFIYPRTWKETEENEETWRKMNESERNMKENERKWKENDENEEKWRKMNRNERNMEGQ